MRARNGGGLKKGLPETSPQTLPHALIIGSRHSGRGLTPENLSPRLGPSWARRSLNTKPAVSSESHPKPAFNQLAAKTKSKEAFAGDQNDEVTE